MRRLASIPLLLGLLVSPALAEWALDLGTQHFSWTERTSPIEVKESGPIFVVGTDLVQSRERGWLVGYHGEYQLGEVSYNGADLFARSTAASGNTVYTRTVQEAQLRYRVPDALDAVVGLDLDLWKRRLSASQAEDYRVVALRLGGEHRAPAHDPWRVSAGMKLTLSTREDAHFDALGFDRNPILTPGQSFSPYAELGYGFGRRWLVAASLDGFQFGRSNSVVLTKQRVRQVSYQPASDMRVVGLRVEYGR